MRLLLFMFVTHNWKAQFLCHSSNTFFRFCTHLTNYHMRMIRIPAT